MTLHVDEGAVARYVPELVSGTKNERLEAQLVAINRGMQSRLSYGVPDVAVVVQPSGPGGKVAPGIAPARFGADAVVIARLEPESTTYWVKKSQVNGICGVADYGEAERAALEAIGDKVEQVYTAAAVAAWAAVCSSSAS